MTRDNWSLRKVSSVNCNYMMNNDPRFWLGPTCSQMVNKPVLLVHKLAMISRGEHPPFNDRSLLSGFEQLRVLQQFESWQDDPGRHWGMLFLAWDQGLLKFTQDNQLKFSRREGIQAYSEKVRSDNKKLYTDLHCRGRESRPIARKSGQKTKSYTQIYTIGVSLMLYIIKQVFLYIIYSCLQKNKALISCTLFTTVGYIHVPTGKTLLCSLKLGKVVNDIQNQN